jgi:hypothetical protein
MFTYIESRDEVSEAQQTLARTIRHAFSTNVRRGIGFPGGDVPDAKVNTDGKYWYRTANFKDSDIANPRRLNWFGSYEGDPTYYLSITVEINTAYEGRNDNVGGFFGRDNKTGTVYLFHSGRVGGGTKGVSQKEFLAWLKRSPDAVFDSSGDPRLGVLVMPVQGLGATKSLLNYIEAVAEFKKAARDGALGGTEFNQNKKELEEFYSEARGRRKGRRSAIIDYVSRHGDVVDALRDWRSKQPLENGSLLVKNMLIDLGVKLNGVLSEVFEVKTSADRGDIYTAVGQLMVHGVKDCRRVAVLPHDSPVAPELKQALERLGIELLTFRLDEKNVSIVNNAG